ncbi:MAG: SRPBCC family protein [Acidimicrobiales bacterium]
MGRIRVSTVIAAPSRQVWAAIADISRHVDWMDDAVAIRFLSNQRQGIGTEFECDTSVGPIRLTDRMTVTEWVPGRVLGIRHAGLVTGEGRLTLRRTLSGATRFTWQERLRYPWWMGGPVGGLVVDRVMRRVWRGNLRNLKERIED